MTRADKSQAVYDALLQRFKALCVTCGGDAGVKLTVWRRMGTSIRHPDRDDVACETCGEWGLWEKNRGDYVQAP